MSQVLNFFLAEQALVKVLLGLLLNVLEKVIQIPFKTFIFFFKFCWPFHQFSVLVL